jgi:lipopolysaccharide export system permease protein
MRILDRYIVRNFLLNYLLALVVLLGMYILLDLIVNLDRFIKGANVAGQKGVLPLLGDILDFYMYQTLAIFQQVASIIPLFAAAFTMVRMSRHNELTAMLASGVSLFRVAAPIVLLSIAFSLLSVVDQEFIMPRVQEKLMRRHDEINRLTAAPQKYTIMVDHKTNLVQFVRYDKVAKVMYNVWIMYRDEASHVIRRVRADTATWTPIADPSPGSSGGEWVLAGNVRYTDDIIPGAPAGQTSTGMVEDKKLKYTSGLRPAHVELFLSKKAVDFLSLGQVQELIGSASNNTKPNLQKMMHTRVTQPIMNVIMLLLGIPFLLTREPGRLVKNIFICLVVCAICFAATFVLFQMGDVLHSPLLAAWLPVLIFGPISLLMLDTIKT